MSKMSTLAAEADRLGIDTTAPDAIDQTQLAVAREAITELLEPALRLLTEYSERTGRASFSDVATLNHLNDRTRPEEIADRENRLTASPVEVLATLVAKGDGAVLWSEAYDALDEDTYDALERHGLLTDAPAEDHALG